MLKRLRRYSNATRRDRSASRPRTNATPAKRRSRPARRKRSKATRGSDESEDRQHLTPDPPQAGTEMRPLDALARLHAG
jgi:hypothetical protein